MFLLPLESGTFELQFFGLKLGSVCHMDSGSKT